MIRTSRLTPNSLYFLFGMIRVGHAINGDGSSSDNDAHGPLGGCRSFGRHPPMLAGGGPSM
jgi:hypothetical protein